MAMKNPPAMTEQDKARVGAAVTAAENATAGEIVTILSARSDDYRDVALAWSAAVALVALVALALFPHFYLGLYDRLTGEWAREWTPARLLGLAAFIAAAKFAGMWLILLWRPLRLALTPGAIRHRRVHARALALFRVGAERRTTGRTGILIYLSLDEHRAEIVADEAIASKVAAEVWGEALAALLAELKAGRMADGLIAAVGRVGAVLAAHFPRAEDDVNELPDRLIEV
jgi:putative membrane protein